ncbi:MAG TPA: ATP-binding cassette domain-containing protein, partial [Candidatus Methanoperedenaceae archaeon]|nr:ATP-binding cassette domain-containing protein [Candidatus Methanoperedenaceae archaeon]
MSINQEVIEISVKDLNLWYDENHALIDIEIEIPKNRITALIGPSGCGKTTFIRCLDRMNDLIPGTVTKGEILVNGGDITRRDVDVVSLRKKIGMVFQKPNPFPSSIFENIAYG